MEIHLFLGEFPRSQFNVLQDEQKDEFQICCGERNLNEKQRSVILERKTFPIQTQINRYVEVLQNAKWKMTAIISLKVRNLGFKIFFESGFIA